MDKSAIKNFAVNARIKLMDQITQKAFELGITLGSIQEPELFKDGFLINGKFFKKYEIKQRQELVKRIQAKNLSQVIEDVAYTWFNRLIGLRFMEVNGYLPIGVRVLSSIEQGKTEPDVVREVLNVDLGLSPEELAVVYRLQDEHHTEELFKYILIKQCNKLGDIMPAVFEPIANYTELLLPDNLLGEGSIIRDLVTMIAEDDWTEQVEIIGWLYQYYISQKKDEVFADLKKNKKITKENIPAATQLFTPDWIVKYMVENSLGRRWLESHPNPELQSKWKYYLEQAPQEPEVLAQLAALQQPTLSPEDLTVLDPCMGSGHILVYAFDVLYDIYQSVGYPEQEIPKLIIEKNLHGLDIDDRAAQLAYFAVMMKARSYNRRLFRGKLAHNLFGIQESNVIPKDEVLTMFSHLADGQLWSAKLRTDMEYLIDAFYDAKEYGSIIEVQPVDFDSIEQVVDGIRTNKIVLDIFSAPHLEAILQVIPALIQQGRMMSQKYDVVCTNPPYMGAGGMNAKLSKFVVKKFPNTKSDLFAVFIEKTVAMTKVNGLTANINQHSWMFLSSYEKLRNILLQDITLLSMVHLGARAFEEIGGEVVQTVAYVMRNNQLAQYRGHYHRLTEISVAREKEAAFLAGKLTYVAQQDEFDVIPGSPIAYWASERVRQIFKESTRNNSTFASLAPPKKGLDTNGNIELFVRQWWEVPFTKFFTIGNRESYKWFELDKGGPKRKWYGNRTYVINYQNNGEKLVAVHANIRNKSMYFMEGLTYGVISSESFNFRYSSAKALFDQGGPNCFPNEDSLYYVLALGNSRICDWLLKILSPTLNFTVGDIAKIPVVVADKETKLKIDALCQKNINIATLDWDSFETSWDFQLHPLLSDDTNNQCSAMRIEEAFKNWQNFTHSQLLQLQANEEELNDMFIHIYGLQEELTPEVAGKDVTIRTADRVRDIKSFLSYAVGCMFGRYSLDEPGLIYAGGQFTASRYQTFTACTDNILPLTDDEYFENDIVSRFIDLVSITFGKETLEENLDYIAETLNRKTNETSRQGIRRYFLKDFYKDHVQTYQKRPLYWLFDSGKNDGFKALIYIHRYDLSTVAKVRTDYLHILQRKYEAEASHLEMTLDNQVSPREKVVAKKKKEKLQKQLIECYQYDQVIAHVANQKISFDLDDGVKVNYAVFQEIQIPQGDGKKPLKANLLATI